MIVKLLKALFCLAVIAAVAGFCLGVVVVVTVGRDLPQLPDRLEKLVLNTQTEFYSNTGNLLVTMGEKNRIPLDRISRYFVNGVLAAEDAEFYSHHGISKTGIIRALWVNWRAGGIESGASTITQQLAKNFFFSLEQTHVRKVKEILLAFQLEYSFSKEEILEAYCNNMYFGSGAYGVEAASRLYFAKHADQLSLAESALLVAILNGPSVYNPYSNPGRARTRQLWVLRRMEELGLISGAERLKAEQEIPDLKRYTEATGRSSYFLDYVQNQVSSLFGEEFLYYGGLKIYTTLDQRMQSAAVSAVNTHLRALDKLLGLPEYESLTDKQVRAAYLQGALVALESGTGAIRALVGGRNYEHSQFNRADQPNRLPGSAFKPFVYFTALRSGGLSPASTLVDSAVCYLLPTGQEWKPENFEQDYLGRMILKKALEMSRNVIAAQLIEITGPEQVAATARNFGITSALMPTPSLALGTSGVSPIEMAAAYAVFANGGTYYQPYAIKRIEDARGNLIYDPIPRGREVASPQLVFQMVDMMKGVLDGDSGTGRMVRSLGFTLPAGGKTGTTSDSRDAWFVGYIPSLSCACWVGFDDNSEIRFVQNGVRLGLTGARGGAPIWAMFMSKVTEGKPIQDFPIPPGIEFYEVDAWSGMPATELTPAADRIRVALLPEQVEAVRQKGSVADTLAPVMAPAYDPLNP